MSLPRELFVRDGRLCQRPVREIETLWQAETRLTGVTVEAPAALGAPVRLDLVQHPLAACPPASAF